MSEAERRGLGSATRTFPKGLGAAEALKELAEPSDRSEPIKRLIDRAAKRAGFAYWRAFDIWYGKARRIEQFEIDAIADALATKRKEANRNELHELQVRMARLESLLAQADEDFYRPQITALRDQRRSMDRKDGALDRALASSAKPA